MTGDSTLPSDAVMPALPAQLLRAGLLHSSARQQALAASRHARLRGQAFRSLLGAMAASCDSATLAEVIERLPAEAATLLRRGEMVGTAWYPIAWYASLHAAAQEVIGGGEGLARALGRDTIRLDARGIYQFVLRFVSPESLMNHGARVLRLYIDGPRLTVSSALASDSNDVHAAFRFDNAFGFDNNLWHSMLGSIEALIELSGGRHARCERLEDGGDAGWTAGVARWHR